MLRIHIYLLKPETDYTKITVITFESNSVICVIRVYKKAVL